MQPTFKYSLVAPEKIVYESSKADDSIIYKTSNDMLEQGVSQSFYYENNPITNTSIPGPTGDYNDNVQRRSGETDSDYFDDDDLQKEINNLKSRIENLENIARRQKLKEKVMFVSFGAIIFVKLLRYFLRAD